ncbi:hypothetical protein VDG1235_3042 [Verrucomicrobiia bacterium DG1235]|nr:hypothetical protein VDG1235_3042 [Verrucomicrobiae bacterium DG1235]
MEAIFVILAFGFVLLPLPLCIYLLIQRKQLSERLDHVEEQLKTKRSSPQAPSPTPQAKPAEASPEATKPVEHPVPKPIQPAVTSEPIPTKKPAPKPRPTPTPTPPKPKPAPPAIPAFLRSIGLLPPLDMQRNEAGIIQWWALRIGGLLAVLTAIFFSVYISKNTSPLVRFIELLAADAAVLGLGAYFWKRRQRFATILVTVGLCMLYVSMVSGYAASPVRVFTNPIIGIFAQFAVIALIYGTSIRLKEQSIAFLATLLGFFSSIFSAYVGLNEGALISAIVLQCIGCAFGYRWKHVPLFTLSILGVFLPVATFCGLTIIRSQSFTLPYGSAS